jgi:VWFA-related protein
MRWTLRIAVLLLTVAAAAQMREVLTVSVVEVPVTVVDSGGNPVRGLTSANFRLYDNGKEVAITSFDAIDFASEQTMQAISPMNPAARRNFLLLFDLSFSRPGNLGRAQEAARMFVEKAAGPRDLIGVGTIDTQHGFHLLSSFTSDRKLVAEAIAHPGELKSTDPLHLGNNGNNVDVADQSSGVATRGNAALGSENAEALVASAIKQNRETVRAQVEKQMDFLGDLAKTLRAVPGRKHVLLLSEGFDSRFVQGRDARDNYADTDNAKPNIDSDARYGTSSSMSALQRMTKFFRGSDVILHALDIQGLRVQNDVSSGSVINNNASLALLAEPTGGMVFQNVNKVDDNLKRMLHSQEVVYVLAFRASSSKPGQFHDLKVKLVSVPGSAKVSNRAGYYEGGSETAQERALSNAEIITNDIPQGDVKVSAVMAAFGGASENAQVPVVLEIDGSDLIKDAKSASIDAEVYLYAFDSDGSVRDRAYQKLTLDLKKVGDKLRGSGIKYYSTLSLPPGRYAVKALVRVPSTERKGFVRSDVTVAKKGEMVVLPPIFVEEQPKWLMVKGASHDPNAPYPFELNGEQFIPATGAHARDGGTKRFAVFIQNPPADELTFDANQKVKFIGAAKTPGSTAFVMELGKIDPAIATLDVTVRLKGASGGQKTSVVLGGN